MTAEVMMHRSAKLREVADGQYQTRVIRRVIASCKRLGVSNTRRNVHTRVSRVRFRLNVSHPARYPTLTNTTGFSNNALPLQDRKCRGKSIVAGKLGVKLTVDEEERDLEIMR